MTPLPQGRVSVDRDSKLQGSSHESHRSRTKYSEYEAKGLFVMDGPKETKQGPTDSESDGPNPDPSSHQQQGGSGQNKKRKNEKEKQGDDSGSKNEKELKQKDGPVGKKEGFETRGVPVIAPRAPITRERVPAQWLTISNPSTPCATYAPAADGSLPLSYRTYLKRCGNGKGPEVNMEEHEDDYETTYPMYEYKNKSFSVLQKHVSFFDRDNDGVIWPQETWTGFRALGFNYLICALAVLILHGGMSFPTFGWWVPDPFFRIYLENIHKDKHGSDSGSFDKEGRFKVQEFEDKFSQYGEQDSLNLCQLFRMIRGNRDVLDPYGWTASFLEWITVYLLVWPTDRRVPKEEIRGILDGSFFYLVQERELERRGVLAEGKPKEPWWQRENKFGSTIET